MTDTSDPAFKFKRLGVEVDIVMASDYDTLAADNAKQAVEIAELRTKVADLESDAIVMRQRRQIDELRRRVKLTIGVMIAAVMHLEGKPTEPELDSCPHAAAHCQRPPQRPRRGSLW